MPKKAPPYIRFELYSEKTAADLTASHPEILPDRYIIGMQSQIKINKDQYAIFDIDIYDNQEYHITFAEIKYKKFPEELEKVAAEMASTLLDKFVKTVTPDSVNVVINTSPEKSEIRFKIDSYSKKYDSPAKRILTPGNYIVWVEPPINSEYAAERFEIQVPPGDSQTKPIPLMLTKRKEYFKLKSQNLFQNALFYIDDKKTKPLAINTFITTCGSHSITAITAKGLIYHAPRVEIKAGKINTVHLDTVLENVGNAYIPPKLHESTTSHRIEQIASHGNTIYVRDQKGTVQALNAYSHAKYWNFRRRKVVDGPFIFRDRLFLLCARSISTVDLIDEFVTHQLVELDLKNGKIKKKIPFLRLYYRQRLYQAQCCTF